MPSDIFIIPNRGSTSVNPVIQFSGSAANTIRLETFQSGSVAYLGSSGQLQIINDVLTGSLMAVSDISGLPILEVSSDDKVVMGKYNSNALVVSGSKVGIGKSPTANSVLEVSGSSIFSGSLRVSAFNNVGIGTSVLNWPLTVAAPGQTGLAIVTTDVNLTPATGTIFYVGLGSSTGSTYGTLDAITAGNSRQNIIIQQTSAASVGIGTISPNGKLDVNGNLFVTGSTLFTGSLFQIGNSFLTGSSFITGALAVNKTNPNGVVDVNGNVVVSGSVLITNALSVGTSSLGGTGEIRATGTITQNFSDDRLKIRLNNINDPIGKINALSGFYYRPNSLAITLGYFDKIDVGVSAQEVDAVLPQIVAPAPVNDKYLTVRYEKLAPLLIEGIKQLSVELNDVKSQLNELKKTISTGSFSG